MDKTFPLPADWTDQVNVLVLGCGGTGSEIMDALARLHHVLRALEHPGLRITLQDGDTVSPANVGRQRFLEADVGNNKAEVLARRYGFLMRMEITPRRKHMTQRDLRERKDLFGFHLVITAVDRASVRTELADAWQHQVRGPLWLDSGNGSSTGQVVLGHLAGAQENRLPHVLDLFPGIRTTPDDDEPSCSVAAAIRTQNLGVNRFMADAAVFTILAPLFTKGQIDHHGALVDMAKPNVAPLKIDPQAWAFYGYHPDQPPAPAKRRSKKHG